MEGWMEWNEWNGMDTGHGWNMDGQQYARALTTEAEIDRTQGWCRSDLRVRDSRATLSSSLLTLHRARRQCAWRLLLDSGHEGECPPLERHPARVHLPSEWRTATSSLRTAPYASGFQLRRVRAGSVADLYTH